MPALSITPTTLELDWLADALRDAQQFSVLSSPVSISWLQLERMALSLGMPDGQDDGVVAWAENYLRQHGRSPPRPAALTVGTAQYRRHHIAMLWTAGLWHEAVQLLFLAVTLGLLFYAVASVAN